jgi:hypothetical protein
VQTCKIVHTCVCMTAICKAVCSCDAVLMMLENCARLCKIVCICRSLYENVYDGDVVLVGQMTCS